MFKFATSRVSMNRKDISKQEYKARINKVMDYLARNLEKPIDLDLMAQIAAFSPYHFHRIFTFIVGETPNNFVSRIKLEKAAQMLHDNPYLPVSEIAFKCGFNSPSSFSRSFKAYFGMNTKIFRENDPPIYVKDGIRYSKIGIAVRKIGKHPQPLVPQLCSVELNELIMKNVKIEIKQMPELNVIYCRHKGAFNKIGEAYEKLFKWAGPRGLVSSETRTVTVYLDDPAVTAVENVRQDASIIVNADVMVEGEIGKSTVSAGRYAVGHFELKESEFEKAWNTMCSWLTESGYQPNDGPTYEYYHNHYDEHPEHKFIVDICIPVKPL